MNITTAIARARQKASRYNTPHFVTEYKHGEVKRYRVFRKGQGSKALQAMQRGEVCGTVATAWPDGDVVTEEQVIKETGMPCPRVQFFNGGFVQVRDL